MQILLYFLLTLHVLVCLLMVLVVLMQRPRSEGLGALVYLGMEEVLKGFTEHWMAIFGPLIVVIALVGKHGIAGLLQRFDRARPHEPATGAVATPLQGATQ